MYTIILSGLFIGQALLLTQYTQFSIKATLKEPMGKSKYIDQTCSSRSYRCSTELDLGVLGGQVDALSSLLSSSRNS